eukprot:GFKZ01004600.1.p1 GENE.GFKZ01004600.1~~GFKZ01004600.1.p1  ORF type:complete len:546 (+),score=82.50 GFKZ01004600.1:191-1828(+)
MFKFADPPLSFERWIVLDTGALIAGTDNLYALGGLTDSVGLESPPRLAANETVKFFVTPDVASETRDANARNRLQVLERLGSIVARAPSAEAVAEVARYAKLTGDYPVLSVTDLRVLALTYMLEVERNGLQFIKPASEKQIVGDIRSAHTAVKFEDVERWEKDERDMREREEGKADGWTTVPSKQKVPKPLRKKREKKAKKKKGEDQNVNFGQRQQSRAAAEGQQFEYIAQLNSNTAPPAKGVSRNSEVADTTSVDISVIQTSEERHDRLDNTSSEVETASRLFNSLEFSGDHNRKKTLGIVDSNVAKAENTGLDKLTGHEQNDVTLGSGQLNVEYLSEEDDGIGWINEENLEEHLARDGGEESVTEEDRRRVACVTTDFAMQNTMLQMGLKLLSVDGRRTIRQIKSFALRCHSCGAITRELHRKFCERCGNATMHRVAFNVNKKGIARAFLNPKKTPILRGTKYPIPLPRGGRHNKDLILCEDQIDPVKQKRTEKQRQRLNVDVLDPGSFYNAGARFNPHGKPLIVGYGKRNPNEVRPSSKSKQ